MPSASSSSEMRTLSTPRSAQILIGCSPAKGAPRPSATERGSTGTGLPASSPRCRASESSGSTATTRRPSAATAIPETSPPPPTGTTITAASGTSSRISRPTVPWPPSVAEEKTGVRCNRPAIASRAARTSSRESSAAMERLGRLAGELCEHLLGLGLVEPPEVADAGDEEHRQCRDNGPGDRDPQRRRDADHARDRAREHEPQREERERAHPVPGAD